MVAKAVQEILKRIPKKNKTPSSGGTPPGIARAPESRLTEMVAVELWEPSIDLGGLQGFKHGIPNTPRPRRDTKTGLGETTREKDKERDTPRIPWIVPWPDFERPEPDTPKPPPDKPNVPTDIPPVERTDLLIETPESDTGYPTPPPPPKIPIEDEYRVPTSCEAIEDWIRENTGVQLEVCAGGVGQLNITGSLQAKGSRKKATGRGRGRSIWPVR